MVFSIIKLFFLATAVSMVTADSSILRSGIGIGNEDKIVGGSPSEPHSHPYLVSIQKELSDGSWDHFCGGAIVSSEKIVTAAHCLLNKDISNLRIVAGEHDLSVEEGTEQITSIKSAAIHPAYDVTLKDNDFAYLYLGTNLTLNENVAVIPFVRFEPSSRLGDFVSMGWGNTRSDTDFEYPNLLQEVFLATVPRDECNVIWEEEKVAVTSNMLCAGGVEGQGSCVGDSGGPLVFIDGTGQKYLAGIVSFGKFPCAQKGIPSIYGNVAAGKIWLQEERALCPPSMIPCSCNQYIDNQNYPSISCGKYATPETFSTAMSTFRSYNGLTSNDILSIYEFEIESFGENNFISTFDLTPLLWTNITMLSITYNRYVTSIVGPTGVEYEGSIKTKSLTVLSTPFTDEGWGDALKYFDPQYLADLAIGLTEIHGGQHLVQNGDGSTDVEFLPGLSRFKTLSSLYLSYNPITTISGGQFKRNSNLLFLYLRGPFISNTTDFGDSAFLFGEPDPELLNEQLEIDLFSSKLTEDNFKGMKNSGLLTNKRPILLYLDNNNFEYIPEEYFKPFLDAHPRNEIDAFMDLYCDQRMQWLKHNADIYQHKVFGAKCRNDPSGADVFNTDLIF